MDYNKMEMKDFIKRVLNEPELCPCLMIGEYVNEFKKRFVGTIERAYRLDEIKRIVESYDGVTSVNSGVLVIEGIGFLSDTGQNSMLKFIEEAKVPIILLSYNDKVSSIIHSRMKIVVKRWKPVQNMKFQKARNAYATIQDKKRELREKFSSYEEIQYMADNCPELYGITQCVGNPYDFLNERMLNVMFSSTENS